MDSTASSVMNLCNGIVVVKWSDSTKYTKYMPDIVDSINLIPLHMPESGSQTQRTSTPASSVLGKLKNFVFKGKQQLIEFSNLNVNFKCLQELAERNRCFNVSEEARGEYRNSRRNSQRNSR